MQDPRYSKGSFLSITLLILSGELVYMLPYVLARVFRPTFLEVFDLTNFELGSLFSVYGVVALLSYLYGGVLADQFLPRKLIALSLFLTAIGGLVMATYPSYLTLQILFGYWGFTTVFLFWGAMIKATRLWGGTMSQGQAFGFLDAGRGLVAASMGSVGVFIFSLILTSDIRSATLIERQEAFRYVIFFTSFMVALVGLLVFVYMKSEGEEKIKEMTSTSSFSNIKSVIKIPSVWLLMIIIMSAYVGYKLTDIYSLYASDVMLYDQIQAAEVGALQLYLRPIVCVIIGFLADKTSGTSWIIIGFVIMLLGAVIFASGIVQSNMDVIFFISLIIIAVGTYAARALYFAVFQEGKIPLAHMGTAVGIISVVGYTPDVFASPIMGYLLDTYPGITGHQYVFSMLVVFSILGLLASIRFAKLVKTR
jgi:sugar phosphate permease|tara:strand:- start:1138 stop:2403 length:1266 start_codon:yes stop_codon:yes gene_type:complete